MNKIRQEPAGENGATAPDPFDLDSLRLSTNYADELGIEKVITHVAVTRPKRHQFVRVRPGDEWQLMTTFLVLKDDGADEVYLVPPRMRGELADEVQPRRLVTAITKAGQIFLWPLRLPDGDGRRDGWCESATAAAELAQTRWVRIAAMRGAGCYDVLQAKGDIAEPSWPNLSFKELLELAFRGRTVDSVEHLAYKRLRGLV